ncbi:MULTISPECIES: DUF5658 family protein [Paenibacillus]|uniref:DUF5658 family protein n=1 Tax=Paenibacillus TaxID=44249 RepID=UPI00111F151E|nr:MULTISPECIES: DUF5658 family protein [Paenibacillus]
MAAIQKWDLNPLLLGLLFLCFADAFFTDIGLRMQLIEEMNPLIKQVYDWNVAGYYSLKLVLPVLLFLLYCKTSSRKWINPCILLTTTLYFAVNIYHLIWISFGVREGAIVFELF